MPEKILELSGADYGIVGEGEASQHAFGLGRLRLWYGRAVRLPPASRVLEGPPRDAGAVG